MKNIAETRRVACSIYNGRPQKAFPFKANDVSSSGTAV
jgi:hypothetical protein